MFDIGFTEIALISVVALLIVGPERLPSMVRKVGLWVGRIRRYATSVRQDIERELHAEELRELSRESGKIGGELGGLKSAMDETRNALGDMSRSFKEAAREAESELDNDERAETKASVSNEVTSAKDTVDTATEDPSAAAAARQEELALDIDGDASPEKRESTDLASERR